MTDAAVDMLVLLILFAGVPGSIMLVACLCVEVMEVMDGTDRE